MSLSSNSPRKTLLTYKHLFSFQILECCKLGEWAKTNHIFTLSRGTFTTNWLCILEHYLFLTYLNGDQRRSNRTVVSWVCLFYLYSPLHFQEHVTDNVTVRYILKYVTYVVDTTLYTAMNVSNVGV